MDIGNLSDEEFAILANDAAWLDAHQFKIAQASSLAAFAPQTPQKS